MAPVPIEHTFQLALAHHREGRLAEAEALYRRILSAQPHHADALHLLGVIAHQTGHSEAAVERIEKAIALVPTAPAFHSNLGEAFRKLGRLEEAIAAFRRAIQIHPSYAKGHINLGAALIDQGLFADAETAVRAAIALEPEYAEAHGNLGFALWGQRRLEESVVAYRRAVALQPDYVEAHHHLGIALLDRGLTEEAAAAFRRAIELKPDYAPSHNNLGYALRNLGFPAEAAAACRRALQLQPGYAEAHNNQGIALLDQSLPVDAEAAFRRAIELRPEYAPAHGNLGAALVDQGRWRDAEVAYRRALELDPNLASARKNYSLLLLLHGDFERGWPLYEARWDVGDLLPSKRNFPQPMWRGEALHGETMLVHAEQGFGDAVQFIRYAPLVAQRGGRVVVECQPELKTLFANIEGVAQIIARGEPLPAFKLHCPMLSLPLAFGTREETIPSTVPYLRADPARTARWRERLDREVNRQEERPPSPRRVLKVGLVWTSGPGSRHPDGARIDSRRSLLLSQCGSLAGIPSVIFVSLQKGESAGQAKTPPSGMPLLDWTDDLHDFADTAALIEALDLVISVDTAVAHLTGALGKPVWLLACFGACWRWLLEREDSPWYPTMRIFRQPKFGDWLSVLQRAAAELAALVSQDG